jgi:hypothetical protein
VGNDVRLNAAIPVSLFTSLLKVEPLDKLNLHVKGLKLITDNIR